MLVTIDLPFVLANNKGEAKSEVPIISSTSIFKMPILSAISSVERDK